MILLSAVIFDDLEGAKKIVERGVVDINAQAPSGHTVLHTAANFGANRVAEYLLRKGARLDIETNFGNTPLHYAAKYGSAKIAKMCIWYGADIFAQNEDGRSPAEMARCQYLKKAIETNSGWDVAIGAEEKRKQEWKQEQERRQQERQARYQGWAQEGQNEEYRSNGMRP